MPLRPSTLLHQANIQCLRASSRDTIRGCHACLTARARATASSSPSSFLAVRRTFHSSPPRRSSCDFEKKNHYERLNVGYNATPNEIKKSFYALSKTYHPDTNRSAPNASQTFTLLSESYTVLSNPSRRATYDRDTLRLHDRSSSNAAPRGSYSSTGGRSPTGLSRRRGTFRGPPPSFYRNGGWGSHTSKRKAAHDESTGGAEETAQNQSQKEEKERGESYSSPYSGMGPGSDPFNHRNEDISHFDKEGHTKTQGKEDAKRWQRAKRAMGDDGVEFEPQMSLGAHFLIVSAILAITVTAPIIYLNVVRSGKRKDGLPR